MDATANGDTHRVRQPKLMPLIDASANTISAYLILLPAASNKNELGKSIDICLKCGSFVMIHLLN